LSRKKTTEEFIADAVRVHGDTYDYSEVNYKYSKQKIVILCRKHGPFEQMPYSHLSGNGCPFCAAEERSDRTRRSKDDFVKAVTDVHGDKYDYSKVEYRNNDTKVVIVCPEHGEFLKNPSKLLLGSGCPSCGMDRKYKASRLSREDFVRRAEQVHGKGRYDYSASDYKTSSTKLTVICPEHGPFLQKAGLHLAGQGCPMCCESKGERSVAQSLDRLGVPYSRQYRDPNCKTQIPLPFDFAVFNETKKLAGLIEYQGAQHYRPILYWGGQEGFDLRVQRDEIKRKFCEASHIPLLLIKYTYDDVDGAVRGFVGGL
jgi:hypothetical protein